MKKKVMKSLTRNEPQVCLDNPDEGFLRARNAAPRLEECIREPKKPDAIL